MTGVVPSETTVVPVGALVFGAPGWWPVVVGGGLVFLALLAWGYWKTSAQAGVKAVAITLKTVGILILLVCLLEPLFSGSRVRPGANAFAILVDNSQSMTLRDASGDTSRTEPIAVLQDRSTPWLSQLRRDFDVRQYAFDAQLESVGEDEKPTFDGQASNLAGALDRLAKRFAGQPLAGVLLMTDGVATDANAVQALLDRHAAAAGSTSGKLPPIYPVLSPDSTAADDVSVGPVTVTQTNFEDTPVTLTAQIQTHGYAGRTITVQLLDEMGQVQQTLDLKVEKPGEPLTARFRVKPHRVGVTFYRVRAAADDELTQFDPAAKTQEATLANNARLAAVDRGRGPYRVLYVGGRLNWELKFLQRSLASDDQMQLVGIIRIAKREPKFSFLSRSGEGFNPLFRGFNPEAEEQVEQYDKPVLRFIGPREGEELLGGFPKSAEELNRYHAVILDDVESEFFTQDQLLLVKEFVRQRGGGLLMLGGQESFKNGKYDRTPIGDLLPVYADEVAAPPPNAKFRLDLTREGWLEPWVRLRPDEASEQQRVAEMPPFKTVNQVRGIKPGATVLARVSTDDGASVPALVEQRFGKGRVGAMLVGDLWRWGLKRPVDTESDLEKAWRQTVRWLVAEVPKRVEMTAAPATSTEPAAIQGSVRLAVEVRDPVYAALDNAAVMVHVTAPDGTSLELPADPSDTKAGLYEAVYVPRMPGAYRAHAAATAPDGSEVGQTQVGWTSDPAAEEFADLEPNRELLTRLAQATGGQVVEPSDLDALADELPTKQAEFTDPYVKPMWHTPWVFAIAILCLAAEWGLRRWKGLP